MLAWVFLDVVEIRDVQGATMSLVARANPLLLGLS
jgi:hypothetical protein